MTTLNEQQRALWLDRYALRDASGNPVETTIDETFDRVSRYIADDEEERYAFRTLLEDFKFVPGGRILAGAGAETEKTFYNCYVIPVEARGDNRVDPEYRGRDYPGNDSREAIFDTIKTMVDIMSRGGGVGINWSVLRPSGSYLSRISGTSSGPIGWMDVASVAVGEVIQGGSRRGAAMFMLDDWHPNVLDFIDAKRDNRKITNANISVAVSDAFMEAVKNDEDWGLIFPETDDPEYNTAWDGDIEAWQRGGHRVRLYKTVRARVLWEAISASAWASGEPGVVFLDRYNKQSTAQGLERIVCVNPCGEQGLGAYSVCNLGAMNLYAYVQDGKFSWGAFCKDVGTAIRFLDNVIDKTYYFVPQTKRQQMALRRVGLGVMGLADALVALGIRYGSQQSVDFVESVFQLMRNYSIKESIEIARVKGAARGWHESMWDRPFLSWFADRYLEKVERPPMRNLFLLTQAPTGTTSLLAGVNSGIEPYFSLKTWRDDRTGGRWVYAKAVEELCGITIEHGDQFPECVVTSKDIPVEQHIAVQAAVQRHIDSSVSKTVNAPNEQTVEETRKVFMMAYDSGLKGIAYYRDGSRNIQVLYHENPNERIASLEAQVAELTAKLAFKDRVSSIEHVYVIEGTEPADYNKCPACAVGDVVFEEGCKKCYSCGWSAC
jgi:ribonucleoside-diphosphate reductase alpha chain